MAASSPTRTLIVAALLVAAGGVAAWVLDAGSSGGDAGKAMRPGTTARGASTSTKSSADPSRGTAPRLQRDSVMHAGADEVKDAPPQRTPDENDALVAEILARFDAGELGSTPHVRRADLRHALRNAIAGRPAKQGQRHQPWSIRAEDVVEIDSIRFMDLPGVEIRVRRGDRHEMRWIEAVDRRWILCGERAWSESDA